MGPEDRERIRRQLGRLRYQPRRVAARCARGYPAVVEGFHPPGEARPGETLSTSLDWITCPWLEQRIQALENQGWLAHLRWLLEQEGATRLRESVEAAAREYTSRVRAAHEARSPGTFARRYGERILGIGGTARVLGLKCLHNHAAASLSGQGTPLGELALALVALDSAREGRAPLDCGSDCMARPEEFGMAREEV